VGESGHCGPYVGLGHEVEDVKCAWCLIWGVVADTCAFVSHTQARRVVNKLGLLILHESGS
jgi:hypothetical protein